MLPDSVSRTTRSIQVVASILFCFTIAGLIFGFAALKPILIDSDVYAHLCNGDAPCKKQDTRLNLLFTVASSTTNVAALPMGAFLDRVGPRIASITGGVIFGLGCIVFSLGVVQPAFDSYLLGYTLMALGAPAMFLAQFHLSNAFPSRSGLILGAVTGAFDASSLPLVFYKLVYFAHGNTPSMSVNYAIPKAIQKSAKLTGSKTFFLSYMFIPILLIIYQLTVGPSEIYIRPSSSVPDRPVETPIKPPHISRRNSSGFSRRSYAISEDADDEDFRQVLEAKREDPIVGVLFGQSVMRQILTSWWLLMLFQVVVHMTRLNWYMATVNTQLVFYTGDIDLADKLTDAFIFLLPLGGIVSIPAIGWLLDTRPMTDITIIMGVMGLLFGILGLVRNKVGQLIGIAFLVVFRPLYYTAISDYAAKVFGFTTFGTVYGLAMTASGLFGLILTPLDILVKGPLNGSYTALNVVLLLLGVVSSLLLYVRVRTAPRIALPVDEERRALESNVILEEDEEED